MDAHGNILYVDKMPRFKVLFLKSFAFPKGHICAAPPKMEAIHVQLLEM